MELTWLYLPDRPSITLWYITFMKGDAQGDAWWFVRQEGGNMEICDLPLDRVKGGWEPIHTCHAGKRSIFRFLNSITQRDVRAAPGPNVYVKEERVRHANQY